jgi:acetate kinase
MADAILTLNAGSSSLKFSLFEAAGGALARIADGEIEGIGQAPRFTARAGAQVLVDRRWEGGAALGHETFLAELLDWVGGRLGADRLIAVGHRIVHGGPDFQAPVRLDAATLAKLDALVPLAPLHQPHNLAAVRAAAEARPDVLQVGAFDTAFHHGHAPVVDRFGLPREWEARGVRRYGFHGLSYEYIAGRMAELDPVLAGGRMIVAHLGAGASLCAIEAGRSRDTTMGFTALDGLVMGTRSGSLDPGVILYLLQSHGFDAAALEDLLYRRSGLLGVSGISADMRTLLASADPHAAEAVELFVFRVVREIGALAASMGGVDGLVFTAGIGERSPPIRAAVCAQLAWLGLAVDPALNAAGGGRVSPSGAARPVWAIATDEESVIARHALEVAAQCGVET